MIEEEMKEEMKEDVDPHNGADDGECGAHPALMPLGLSTLRPPSGRAQSGGRRACGAEAPGRTSRHRMDPAVPPPQELSSGSML